MTVAVVNLFTCPACGKAETHYPYEGTPKGWVETGNRTAFHADCLAAHVAAGKPIANPPAEGLTVYTDANGTITIGESV